jgi:hypothetical protein
MEALDDQRYAGALMLVDLGKYLVHGFASMNPWSMPKVVVIFDEII